MFLVPDPSSWVFELPIAPLPAPPLEPQVSILRMLLMAMMFGAFITVGCVMDASVVRTYIAGFIQFLVPYGWAVWEYRVYSALLLWKVLFTFLLFWDPRSNPEPVDTRPRRVRRAAQQAYRRATRPHRHYTRVRRTPPTVADRLLVRRIDAVHACVPRVLRYVQTNGHVPLVPPPSGRVGARTGERSNHRPMPRHPR